ncbi:MAG: hypothetical protein GX359_03795 [Clostridiales bacterium]|nr:hypothetical protein [Clostridiales bacterium]
MIYDVDKLDIMAARKDGGVELYIISSGILDDSPNTQTLLLDKIQNYLGYINSNKFKKEFPNTTKEGVWIILKMEEEPPLLIKKLCNKIVPWVQDNGANFVINVER